MKAKLNPIHSGFLLMRNLRCDNKFFQCLSMIPQISEIFVLFQTYQAHIFNSPLL